MSNGFLMRVFTIVSKQVYLYLRQQGYMSEIFLDDLCTQGDTKQKCLRI